MQIRYTARRPPIGAAGLAVVYRSLPLFSHFELYKKWACRCAPILSRLDQTRDPAISE